MIEMFGRELSLEQLKGFVEKNENKGEVKVPAEWMLELIDKVEKSKKLQNRLDYQKIGKRELEWLCMVKDLKIRDLNDKR